MTTLVAASNEDIDEGEHTLCVLDETGDTRISWDADDAADTATARRMFDDLKAKGYVAYSVKKERREVRSEVMRSFDPSAEKLIMTPPMRGG